MKTAPQPPLNGRQFIAPKEAATLLGIDVRTIYDMARVPPEKGGPPVRRFSTKLIRFPRQKFIDWANDVTKPLIAKQGTR